MSDYEKEGLLFILCGPSGVGKTTIAHRLLGERDRTTFSVSYTTRDPRDGEVDGVAYHFVAESTFESMWERGEFAESATVHGNSYGTAKATLQEAWSNDQDPVFDIDYQGAEQLKTNFPHAVAVLIIPPNMAELERRLRDRDTDSEEVIEHRLAAARDEMSHYEIFDYVVENDELDATFEAVKTIYDASQHLRHVRAAQVRSML